MYIKTNLFKKKLRSFLQRVMNKIDNSGNDNFNTNGEKVFINNLFYSFKESKDIKKRIIFDIGANIGEYSQLLLDESYKIDIDIELNLFEPTKSCFAELKEKFDTPKIKLNNFGVSKENTYRKIYYNKEKSGLASLHKRNLDYYGLEMNKNETVQLRRMDEYIEESNIIHIDYVKIDIEGHELDAFEGFGKYMDSDFIDFIQFEYGDANLGSNTTLMEMYKFLKERGFIIAKVMPLGIEIREYYPFSMENFTQSNYVAVSNKIVDK